MAVVLSGFNRVCLIWLLVFHGMMMLGELMVDVL